MGPYSNLRSTLQAALWAHPGVLAVFFRQLHGPIQYSPSQKWFYKTIKNSKSTKKYSAMSKANIKFSWCNRCAGLSHYMSGVILQSCWLILQGSTLSRWPCHYSCPVQWTIFSSYHTDQWNIIRYFPCPQDKSSISHGANCYGAISDLSSYWDFPGWSQHWWHQLEVELETGTCGTQNGGLVHTSY